MLRKVQASGCEIGDAITGTAGAGGHKMHEATVLPKWQISLGLRNQSEPQIRAEEMFVSGLVSAGDKQATSTLDIRE